MTDGSPSGERKRWRRLALGATLGALACGFTVQRLTLASPDEVAPAAASAIGGVSSAAEDDALDEMTADEAVTDDSLADALADDVSPLAAAARPSLSADAVPPAAPAPTVASPDAPPAVPPVAFVTAGGAFAWQPVRGGVDGTLWRGDRVPLATASARGDVDIDGAVVDGGGDRGGDGDGDGGGDHGHGLRGIGFPGLELVERLPETRRRVWRPLISWHEARDDARGRVPIPHVRCMGLSPAEVAHRVARIESRVLELSIEHGVSASLVKALIAAESCFDPQAVSPVGALGLMQLMPATAAWLGSDDPLDIDSNLAGGIRYLARLQRRFGDVTLALAAYNAGPTNVRRHGGVPPFAETRAYVRKVLAFHRRFVAATALAAR